MGPFSTRLLTRTWPGLPFREVVVKAARTAPGRHPLQPRPGEAACSSGWRCWGRLYLRPAPTSSFLPAQPWEAAVMAQEAGFLPPMWGTWIGFPALALVLAPSRLLWAFKD